MTKKIDGDLTHQPSKQFNTYKEGLDLELLREYCIEHGEVQTFLRGGHTTLSISDLQS